MSPASGPRAGVSNREFARIRGVSEMAVRKALKAGRIHKLPDGSLDPATATREWDSNTDPTKPSNSVSGDPMHRADPAQPPAPMRDRSSARRIGGAAARDASRADPRDVSEGASQKPSSEAGYYQARTQREILRVRREGHELALEMGNMVKTADVLLGAAACAQKRIEEMDALAGQCAPIVALLTDPEDCRRAIQEKVDKLKASLHVALKYPGGGEVPG